MRDGPSPSPVASDILPRWGRNSGPTRASAHGGKEESVLWTDEDPFRQRASREIGGCHTQDPHRGRQGHGADLPFCAEGDGSDAGRDDDPLVTRRSVTRRATPPLTQGRFYSEVSSASHFTIRSLSLISGRREVRGSQENNRLFVIACLPNWLQGKGLSPERDKVSLHLPHDLRAWISAFKHRPLAP